MILFIEGIECAVTSGEMSFTVRGLAGIDVAISQYSTEDTVTVVVNNDLAKKLSTTRLVCEGLMVYDAAIIRDGLTFKASATLLKSEFTEVDELKEAEFVIKTGNGAWWDAFSKLMVCDFVGEQAYSVKGHWLAFDSEEYAFPSIPTQDPFFERAFVHVMDSLGADEHLKLTNLTPLVFVKQVLENAFSEVGFGLNQDQSLSITEIIEQICLPTGHEIRDDYQYPTVGFSVIEVEKLAIGYQTISQQSDLGEFRANPLNIPNPNHYWRAPYTGKAIIEIVVNAVPYNGLDIVLVECLNTEVPPTSPSGGIQIQTGHEINAVAGNGYRLILDGLSVGDIIVYSIYYADPLDRQIEWKYNALCPRDAFIPKSWLVRDLFLGLVKQFGLMVTTGQDFVSVLMPYDSSFAVRDSAGNPSRQLSQLIPFFNAHTGRHEVLQEGLSLTTSTGASELRIEYAKNGIETSSNLEEANKQGTWSGLFKTDENGEVEIVVIDEFASAPNCLIPQVSNGVTVVTLPTVTMNQNGGIEQMIPLLYVGDKQTSGHPLARVLNETLGTIQNIRPLMAYQFDPFTTADDNQLVFGSYKLNNSNYTNYPISVLCLKQFIESKRQNTLLECGIVSPKRVTDYAGYDIPIEREVFGIGASFWVLDNADIEYGSRHNLIEAVLTKWHGNIEPYGYERMKSLTLIDTPPSEGGQDGADGVDGQDGQDGQDGTAGLSAYQIAVQNGFVGSETAWLASLVGQDGVDGISGTDGTNGTNGTNGQGVPTGGTAGQILQKVNGTDFNTIWASPQTFKADLVADFLTTTANVWTTITGFSFTPEVNSLYRVEVYGARTITSAVAASQGLRLFMSGASQFVQHDFEAIVPSSGSAGTFMYSVNINSASTNSVASASTAANVTLRPLVASGHFKTGATVGAVSVQVNAITAGSVITVHAGCVFIVTKIV